MVLISLRLSQKWELPFPIFNFQSIYNKTNCPDTKVGSQFWYQKMVHKSEITSHKSISCVNFLILIAIKKFGVINLSTHKWLPFTDQDILFTLGKAVYEEIINEYCQKSLLNLKCSCSNQKPEVSLFPKKYITFKYRYLTILIISHFSFFLSFFKLVLSL